MSIVLVIQMCVNRYILPAATITRVNKLGLCLSVMDKYDHPAHCNVHIYQDNYVHPTVKGLMKLCKSLCFLRGILFMQLQWPSHMMLLNRSKLKTENTIEVGYLRIVEKLGALVLGFLVELLIVNNFEVVDVVGKCLFVDFLFDKVVLDVVLEGVNG